MVAASDQGDFRSVGSTYSEIMILPSYILHFLWLYTVFVPSWPNAYVKNVSQILHYLGDPTKTQNWAFAV